MVTNESRGSMTLKEVFEDRVDRKYVFIKQGGNQGDFMIYAGARKLADSLGLKYREINMGRGALTPDISPKEIIYINGGGGFTTWWNWTPRLLNALYQKYHDNLIIVGPSTVAPQDWYIKKWLPSGRNIIFFAREWTTLEYIKNIYPGAQIDHDTALQLEAGDPYLKELLGGVQPSGNFRLLAIREDPESLDHIPPEIDPSRFKYAVDPCQTQQWAYLHAKASEIVTNRSHSAILGAILGKPTLIFAGSYHKNRSIYEYSLKRMGVKWIGEY